MKASLYARMQYVTPQDLPGGWPIASALYDHKIGMQCFQDGIEKLEFADHLGFDWISFSEHHYSYNSVAPHPAVRQGGVRPGRQAARGVHGQLAAPGRGR
jgi:hypothetical protein